MGGRAQRLPPQRTQEEQRSGFGSRLCYFFDMLLLLLLLLLLLAVAVAAAAAVCCCCFPCGRRRRRFVSSFIFFFFFFFFFVFLFLFFRLVPSVLYCALNIGPHINILRLVGGMGGRAQRLPPRRTQEEQRSGFDPVSVLASFPLCLVNCYSRCCSSFFFLFLCLVSSVLYCALIHWPT